MSGSACPVVIRAFEPVDQQAARALILDGLGRHFGFIDESLNPDLDDIAASFAGGAFFVACIDDEIAGTGGLLHSSADAAQIVRMSTAYTHRRRGIATAVLTRLIEEAGSRDYTRVTLVTHAGWEDARSFYAACGFREAGRTEQAVRFELTL